MDSLNLINPINTTLNQIKESLYERELITVGNESLLYGTFKADFEKFRIDNKRVGKNIFKIDFYNSKLNELNTIEEGVINIEKQFGNLEYNSTLKNISNIRNQLIELISNEQPMQKTHKKTILTYKWISSYNKRKSLYKSLKSNNLIDKQTSYNDFELIFNNQNISKIENPIIWLSSNASELLYFIMNIQGIVIEKKERQNYLLLKSCFLKPNGIEFSENFKNINTELEIKLSKEKQRTINNIIQEIAI